MREFNARVHSLGGGRSARRQMLSVMTLLPRLAARRCQVVIDLQRNRVSRLVRRLLMPRSWAEFDRYTAIAAGERTRRTVEATGLGAARASSRLALKNEALGLSVLREGGWRDGEPFVVLNPAGCRPTKNWPLANYAEFARLWRRGSGGRSVTFARDRA